MSSPAPRGPGDRAGPAAPSTHLLRLAREGGNRVLYLAVGDGTVAAALAREADKDVTCVDPDDGRLEQLAEHPVRRTVRADVEDGRWLDELAGEQFDVLVLAEPLARLDDPVGLLARLRDRQLVAPGGHLVVRAEDPAGADAPLDPTRALLEGEGFTVTRILRADDPSGLVLRAEPLGAGPAEQARELERLRRRAQRATTRRDRAQLRAETLERQVKDLQRQVTELERRLADVHTSRTWRAGRVVVGLPAMVKRWGRR